MLKQLLWMFSFVIYVQAYPYGWLKSEKPPTSAAAICKNVAVAYARNSKIANQAYEDCMKSMKTKIGKIPVTNAEYGTPWGAASSESGLRNTLALIDTALQRKTGERWRDDEDDYGLEEENELRGVNGLRKQEEKKPGLWRKSGDSSEESWSKSEEWEEDSSERDWERRPKTEDEWKEEIEDYEW